jgi:NADH dehydrogenase
MIAYLAKSIGRKDFPELSGVRGERPLVYLVDIAPALLSPMSKKSQEEALRVLENLGVQVRLNVGVKGYQDGAVVLSDGNQIPTNNLIWTSGVIAREAPGLAEGSTGRGRRILVDAFNKVKNTDNIFAIGDICLLSGDPQFDGGHPQLAQVAIQQGSLLAKNLKRERDGANWEPFRYNDKGSMAIITKYKAVVDLPNTFFKGIFAWATWLLIHIIPIVSFGNKFRLAINWISSLVTNDPNLRLIFRNQDKR